MFFLEFLSFFLGFFLGFLGFLLGFLLTGRICFLFVKITLFDTRCFVGFVCFFTSVCSSGVFLSYSNSTFDGEACWRGPAVSSFGKPPQS